MVETRGAPRIAGMRARFLVVALAGAGVVTLEAMAQASRPVSEVGPVAAADLRCAPEQIEMVPTDASDDDVRVSGCGQTARYVWTWRAGWRAVR